MSTRITFDIDIPDVLCADVICTALEGGIGYWAQARNIKRTKGEDWDYVSCELCELDEAECWDWKRKDLIRTLDYDAVRRGIERVFIAQEFASLKGSLLTGLINPDYMDLDAGDCDVIVQFALLGEVRYG